MEIDYCRIQTIGTLARIPYILRPRMLKSGVEAEFFRRWKRGETPTGGVMGWITMVRLVGGFEFGKILTVL